ncbi:MAG TPA: tetratricopeptide repeat protein [Chryseolinea sp.]|nr:tetratricopeptide repeat protein [Chryseolinea sp.]
MASQIPGYEYDIFISYRHNDNRTLPSNDISHGSRGVHDGGWVSEFVANLSLELEATVKGKVSIYFDRNTKDGLLETHNVDESLGPKIKSLIFIPIISQTYCDEECFAWRWEFLAFNKMAGQDKFGPVIRLLDGNAANRVLPVRIHELDATDIKMLETELKGKLRPIDFIFRTPGVNRPLRANEEDPLKNTNKTFYRDQVNKTANAIKDIINGLKNFEKQPAPAKEEERKPISSILTNLDKKISPFKSLAVLPFVYDATDGNDFFGEGLAEDLLVKLSLVRDLKVTPRSLSFRYRGAHSKQRVDAKALSVGYLVQGSVVKTTEWVWVTVKVSAPEAPSSIWSKEYKCTFNDLPSLTSSLSIDIAEGLNVTFSEADRRRLAKRVTTDSQAYESYLKGRTYRHSKSDGMIKSIKCFDEALSRDPQFASAHGGSAEVFILMGYNGQMPIQESIEKAKEAALRALALDPTMMDAYAVLAFISMCYEWSWPEVEALFRRVFSINQFNPKSEEKYASLLKQISSNLEESANEAPTTIPYFLNAYAMLHLGEFEQALASAEEAVRRDPGSFMAHRALGLSYLGLERFEPAIKALEEAATLSNRHQWLLFELMGAYTQAGRREDALAIMDETMSQANIVPARIYNFLFPHAI